MQQPKLSVIDTEQGINELYDYVQQFEYVAYDSETTGLAPTSEVVGISLACEPDRAFYVVLSQFCTAGQSLVYLPGAYKASVRLLSLLLTKKVICHNAVFDCMMAENFFKVRLIDALHTDTMILAHLLDENRRVGLKELAKDMYGEDAAKEQAEMKASVLANGGSVTKDNYEMYKADYQILGRYGAKDALLTLNLFHDLVPKLFEQGLDEFYYNDESMPLLKGPTYDLNTTGLQMDTQGLMSLKKTLEAECAEAKDFIHQEIAVHVKGKYPGTNKKNHFNIGSSSQLAWLCFGVLGLEFQSLTDEGKNVCRFLMNRLPYQPTAKREFIHLCTMYKGQIYAPPGKHNGKIVKAKKIKDPWAYLKCDKEVLKKYGQKYNWIARLLDYQKKTKLLSTYVDGLSDRITYGVLRPSFLQHGTTSGRYSSRNPNFQNLPRDDKRIKGCVMARPGRSFVGADYSQLEPRVFAYFSKDKRLLEAFKGQDDFYSVIGMEVYGKYDCEPRKEGSPDAFGVKYKKLRDLSKVIALASTYGATAHKLASTTGKSSAETQEDIDSYFERFPGVKQFMIDSHNYAKEHGFVESLFGRRRRIPEAKRIPKGMTHEELPYEARTLLNLAVNHKVQSTGASIVNRGAIRFYRLLDEAGIKAKLVVQVHDSLVAECADADTEAVALLLEEAMVNTTQLEGIALEANPLVGKTLATV